MVKRGKDPFSVLVGQKRTINGKKYERAVWTPSKARAKGWKEDYSDYYVRIIPTRKNKQSPVGYGVYVGPKKKKKR